MIKLPIIIAQSHTLSHVLLARSFKWNIAGRVKATGAQAIAPVIPNTLEITL